MAHWYLGAKRGEPWSPPKDWWLSVEGGPCLRALYAAEDRVYVRSFTVRLESGGARQASDALCAAYGLRSPVLDIYFRKEAKYWWLGRGEGNYVRPMRGLPAGKIRIDVMAATIPLGLLVHELGHHLSEVLMRREYTGHDEPFWGAVEALHATCEQIDADRFAVRRPKQPSRANCGGKAH